MESDNKKSYMQGKVDALQLWGRVCGGQGSCEDCPIGNIRGTNVTCQDFAKQFPQKMLSILTEMDNKEITYYQEYCMRFPDANMDIETLSACLCRKAVFEGYLACDRAEIPDACLECWKQKYVGDVTETDSADSQ